MKIFVCSPIQPTKNTKIDVEFVLNQNSVYLAQLTKAQALKIATELLIEIQRRKG